MNLGVDNNTVEPYSMFASQALMGPVLHGRRDDIFLSNSQLAQAIRIDWCARHKRFAESGDHAEMGNIIPHPYLGVV